MTSIRKEISIDASAERVWDALRDWGGLLKPDVEPDSVTLAIDQLPVSDLA
jgi:hypothetical protein